MPITPFLRHEAFGPEQIELMSAAFLDACAELGLENGRADPTTQLVAARIIELAQRGRVLISPTDQAKQISKRSQDYRGCNRELGALFRRGPNGTSSRTRSLASPSPTPGYRK